MQFESLKSIFLKADTTIITIKHFSGVILRNKDDQYCSVVFSALWLYGSWRNGAQRIKQQFDMSGLFFCCIKYFQLFWKMLSIHLSITFTLYIFDNCNLTFWGMRQTYSHATQYQENRTGTRFNKYQHAGSLTAGLPTD